jgi:hypothetical protein
LAEFALEIKLGEEKRGRTNGIGDRLVKQLQSHLPDEKELGI